MAPGARLAFFDIFKLPKDYMGDYLSPLPGPDGDMRDPQRDKMEGAHRWRSPVLIGASYVYELLGGYADYRLSKML